MKTSLFERKSHFEIAASLSPRRSTQIEMKEYKDDDSLLFESSPRKGRGEEHTVY